MDIDVLLILSQFSDNYVRYCALAELRYRVIQLLIPPKEGLPPEYPRTEATVQYNGNEKGEKMMAILSPMGLYLYSNMAYKILFGRVSLQSTESKLIVTDEQTNIKVTLSFSENVKEKKKMDEKEKEKVKRKVEEWRYLINQGKLQYGMGYQNLRLKPERKELLLERDEQLQKLVRLEGGS